MAMSCVIAGENEQTLLTFARYLYTIGGKICGKSAVRFAIRNVKNAHIVSGIFSRARFWMN